MNFEEILEKHLNAIKNRDLSAYLETIDDSIQIILPNGQLLTGSNSVESFHSDWFNDDDWKMMLNVKTMNVGKELAYVVIDAEYHDIDEDGKAIIMNNYLTMIFKKYEQNWKLIFDQNTKKAI